MYENEYMANLSINVQKKSGEFAEPDCEKAKLITKDITENDTYNASDDGADGYSSVTVDVESSFNKISTVYSKGSGYGKSNTPLIIYRSTNGEYDFSNESQPEGVYRLCADPVKKIKTWGPVNIEFTPSEDFDGFYDNNNTKLVPTGDTITVGDGKTYIFAQISDSSTPPSIVKYNDYEGGRFIFTIS